jgi:probable rRNA maturation factor
MSTATVFGYDEQDHDEPGAAVVDLARWVALAEGVLAAEGVAAGELTLAFVDEPDMVELNQEHMGESYATDVLSFPIDADLALGGTAGRDPDGEPLLLGDVVVCPRVAVANAPAHAGTVDDELALLVVHGVLHVLGHDHATAEDTARMQARELHHLVQLHWRTPAPPTFTAHRS